MAEMGKVSDMLKDMGHEELVKMLVMMLHELDFTVEDVDAAREQFIAELRVKLGSDLHGV